jgi:hypothetical protein
MPLTEDRRAQLDSIVARMEQNGESEDNIRLVVGDFKQKYGNYPDATNASPTPTPTPRPATKVPWYERAVNPLTGTPLREDGTPVLPSDPVSEGVARAEVGAAKGAGSTVASLGELVTRVGAMQNKEPFDIKGRLSMLTDDIPQVRPFQQFKKEFTTPDPNSSIESGAKTAEQIAEFFLIPGGKVAGVPKLLQAGKGAATAAAGTIAQHGRVDSDAGVAGVLGASAPALVSGAGRLARGFKDGARKSLALLLRPGTGEKVSREARRGIDQMLSDGGLVSGSLEKLARSRTALADRAQDALELSRTGDATHFVDAKPILDELIQVRQSLLTPGTGGRAIVPPPSRSKALVPAGGRQGAFPRTPPHTSKPAALEAINRKIADIKYLSEEFGGSGLIPRSALEHVRGMMDEVYKAASLPERVGAASADKAYGDAIRRTLNADDPVRKELAQTLSRRLNARKLVEGAVRKDFPMEPSRPFRAVATSGVGAAIGAATTGGPWGAAIGAATPVALARLVRSPLWRTASATVKNTFAELLSSGQVELASRLAARLLGAGASSATRPDEEPNSPQDLRRE